jgi:hypothetical protein
MLAGYFLAATPSAMACRAAVDVSAVAVMLW